VTPARRCVSCRRSAAKADLIRFAVAEETVVVDIHARQGGRGAYVCQRWTCLDAALRRDGTALKRALRRPGSQVTVDGERLAADWTAAQPAPAGAVRGVAE
jgi:predicted RNA-binding protein YlxR (DUF448 family)